MNNSVIAFALGAGIGAGVAWYFAKAKYEALAKEEIKSVEEAFDAELARMKPKEEDTVKEAEEPAAPKMEHSDSIRKPESIKEYADRIKNGTNYAGFSKETMNDIPDKETIDGPYKIPNEEIGELDDYAVVELSYYRDNILCTDMDERMTEQDIRDTVGRDFSELFDENFDQLCIRNDAKKCDYSILKIDEDFEGE